MQTTDFMSRQQASIFSPPRESVLIAMVDPDQNFPQYFGVWDDILKLQFWDSDVDGEEKWGYPPATEDQLQQIVDFIQKYKNTHSIFAHCEMGISRSAAVSTFIADYIFLDPSLLMGRGIPNNYIRSNLIRLTFGDIPFGE